MPTLLEATRHTIDTTSVGVNNAPAPEIKKNSRLQKVVVAAGSLIAAATLVVSIYALHSNKPRGDMPPLPDFEKSTAVDATTWVGDLPPGTIDRPVKAEDLSGVLSRELATGPTAEPTDWKTLSTGT